MSLATVAVNPGRPSGLLTVAAIPITITLSATAYATATGGFAVDIAPALNAAGPFDSGVNPLDLVPNFNFFGFTSSNFLAGSLVLGTPTYATNADATTAANSSAQTVLRNQGALLTAPCKMRIFGTGAANAAAFAEIADGNLTLTIAGVLYVYRSGAA